mmetsp:Transcript_12816/g.36245  ORF Transcript_12816/g.36245 Transcript_12816/m.36245 type:complete len:244 (-) Transcript_12816:1786-2517(-)
MKECRERLHDHQDSERKTRPGAKSTEHCERVTHGEGEDKHALPEHGGELGVSQGKGPEAEVGSGVGNGTEDELNGVDDLVDHDFLKLKLFLFALAAVVIKSFLLVLEERGALAIAQFLVTVLLLLGLVVALQEEGLGQEHPRHAHEGEQEEDNLEQLLRLPDALRLAGVVEGRGREKHIDQSCEKRRDLLVRVILQSIPPVDEPLENDEAAQVSKDGHHEDDLRDELEEEVVPLATVDRVEAR